MNPVLRWVFRTPVKLYDHGWGRLLGHRFLCLTHVGRKSGRHYRTVLEVIGHDPAEDEVFVIAGLGPSADWYRNIRTAPALEVIIGRRRFTPAHRRLDETEAVSVIAAYEHRNRLVTPILRVVLGKLLGRPYDGTPEARAALAQALPVVALRPIRPGC